MPFYSVTISNRAGRHSSLCWSAPFATAKEAAVHGRALLDRGEATLAMVAVIEEGRRELLPNYVRPKSAQKIIAHWEEAWGALERPEEEK